MTVRELLHELEAFPADAEVSVGQGHRGELIVGGVRLPVPRAAGT
jgi:hypothetical protein